MAFAAYTFPGSKMVTLVKGKTERYTPGTQQADGFYINVFSTNEVFYIDPFEVVNGESFAQLAQHWVKDMYLRPGKAVKENLLADYKATLEEAIAAIGVGLFEKLVISRNQKLTLQQINYAAVLDQLAKAFPECLVYVFSTPHTGTWIGATPEKLLVKKDEALVQTMALAGTIKSETKVNPEEWGEKEKAEQEMVERYIENIIRQQGYKYNKSKVFTLQTGWLNHLCTGFDVELPSRSSMLALASALHPTPAVGGLPAKEGVHFIKSSEKYLRECYTGYIGPLGIQGQDLLYVNLRCSQVVDDGVMFYAGGGINKGSVAEKEMTEVENKIQNLQRFFKG